MFRNLKDYRKESKGPPLGSFQRPRQHLTQGYYRAGIAWEWRACAMLKLKNMEQSNSKRRLVIEIQRREETARCVFQAKQSQWVSQESLEKKKLSWKWVFCGGRQHQIQAQFMMCCHLSKTIVRINTPFMFQYSFTLAHSVRRQNKPVMRAIHKASSSSC